MHVKGIFTFDNFWREVTLKKENRKKSASGDRTVVIIEY